MDEIVTEIDGMDLDYLIRVAVIAQEQGQSMQFKQAQDGTIKINRGSGMWVGPFGHAPKE